MSLPTVWKKIYKNDKTQQLNLLTVEHKVPWRTLVNIGELLATYLTFHIAS